MRIPAGARTVAELAATMISLPHGGQVRLSDLGTVRDTIAEPRTFARLNGDPIVAFSILRAKGASDVTVADRVAKFIDQLKAEHPEVDLKLIDTSVRYTMGNYESALHTFFEGAALAVIVVFLFLRDLRATVIAAIALPLSIIPAFWVMHLLGFSLNLVSLLAVTLATGILVDDAIVEIENIVRHMRMGKSAFQAAIDAADEIGLAVIAISLTIVAVFAPVSFIGNIAGQYFKQFGLTIAAEVIFSLLAARLITPMLAAYFLKPDGRQERTGRSDRPLRAAGRMVGASTATRPCSSASFSSHCRFSASQPISSRAISSRRRIPAGRISPSNCRPARNSTQRGGSPTSSPQRLHKRPEVTSVFIDGGRIPPGTPEVRKAQLIINYVPKSQRSRSVQQLQAAISKDLAEIPDMKFWFVDDYGARPVSRIVTGSDSADSRQICQRTRGRDATLAVDHQYPCFDLA